MTSHLRPLSGALALLAVAGCGDSTAPSTEAITIHPCETPHWIAYQNDGGPWTVLGEGRGPFTFPATQRLALARARFQGESSVLDVDYLTSAQAVARFNCVPLEGAPTPGFVSGSVAGLSNFRWAVVIFNGIGAYVSTGGTSWQMEAQAVPATLVAVRYDSGTAGGVKSNAVIIRRDRTYLPGSAVPLLDFDSGEAFAPQANTVSFAGPVAYAGVWYMSRGREHSLSSLPLGPLMAGDMPRTGTFLSIPAAHRVAGDIHLMNLSSGTRVVQHYFVEGSDRTLALGPELATPVFTTVAGAPAKRVRLELLAQGEYGASVSVAMSQLTSTRSTRVTLTMTREYVGFTPPVWSLTIPELSGLAGMTPTGAALHAGEFGWYLTGTNRRFDLDATNALDGETTLFAWRQGTTP